MADTYDLDLHLYKDHLENPGSESSLAFNIDWMEDFLNEGYPVWKKVREWGRYIRQQEIDDPNGSYWSGILYFSIGKRFPSFKLRWPAWIAEELAFVKEVRIFRSAIDQLPKWIGQLSHLKGLSISETEAAPLNEDFKQSPVWKSLPPLEIPKWLADTPQLTELNIDIPNFKIRFDPDFCRRSQIHELRISNIQNMVSSPSLLSQLSSLQLLGVGNIVSSDFFSILPAFTSLTTLAFDYRQLQEVPSEIRSLTKLELLQIESTRLVAIPSWIIELRHLEWLSVLYMRNESHIQTQSDMVEYPSFLSSCPNLEWVQIQTTPTNPIRSLYGLSSRTLYWVATRAAYPDRNLEYYIELPPSIIRRIQAEFQFPHSDNFPISLGVLKFYSQYTNQPTCINCNRPLNNYNCDRCHLHYDVAPSLHQSLVKFLAEYYHDSFDDLMQRVKSGIILSDTERERFVHECDYHYWQLLLNDHLPTHDPRLLEELTAKFSVPLSKDHKLML